MGVVLSSVGDGLLVAEVEVCMAWAGENWIRGGELCKGELVTEEGCGVESWLDREPWLDRGGDEAVWEGDDERGWEVGSVILDAEELDDFLKYLILELSSWLFGMSIKGRPCILNTSLILHKYSVGSSSPSLIILQIWAATYT